MLKSLGIQVYHLVNLTCGGWRRGGKELTFQSKDHFAFTQQVQPDFLTPADQYGAVLLMSSCIKPEANPLLLILLLQNWKLVLHQKGYSLCFPMGCWLTRFKLMCKLIQPTCQIKLWSIASCDQILREYANTSAPQFWLKDSLPFCLENIFFMIEDLSYLHKLFEAEFLGERSKRSLCFVADFYRQGCLLLPYFSVIAELPDNPNPYCCLSNINGFEGISKFKWNRLHFYHSKNPGRLK